MAKWVRHTLGGFVVVGKDGILRRRCVVCSRVSYIYVTYVDLKLDCDSYTQFFLTVR